MKFLINLLVVTASLCFVRRTIATSAMDPTEIVGDCSKIQQTADTSGYPIQIGFTSTLDDDVGPNGYLKVDLVYEGLGWVAWGFSQGGMVPGYTVVGIPGDGAPKTYHMTAQSPSGVTVDSSLQPLLNASVTQSSTHTTLTFVKRLQDSNAQLSLDGSGTNRFLVAWGSSNNFGYHGSNRFEFNFELKYCVNGQSSGTPASQSISITSADTHQPLWKAHGLFASVAWGILSPIAIGASLLRRVFIANDLPALWFRLHMVVNLMVFIFTTFAFAFAVRAISLSTDPRHFKDVKHRKTGLAIMILVFVQALSGLCRPHLPHPKPPADVEVADRDKESEQAAPKKSTARIAFEIGHRLLGFTLLIFAWWQVQSGLKLYALYYSTNDLSGAFWAVTGILTGIIFVLYVVHFKFF